MSEIIKHLTRPLDGPTVLPRMLIGLWRIATPFPPSLSQSARPRLEKGSLSTTLLLLFDLFFLSVIHPRSSGNYSKLNNSLFCVRDDITN